MIKFTIIVPVYNVEKYLSDCLQSIKNQTYQNFECLVINDGSVDNSGIIAKNFCDDNQNFLFFDKSNSGLSGTRNFGIEQAKGDFLVFVDSDDLIHFKFLEFANQSILEYQSDLIYIYHKRIEEDEVVKDESFSFVCKSITTRKISQYPNFACTRVCKTNLYNQNPFPEGYIYEDAVTSPLLAYRAKRITEIALPMYYYRRRKDSITGSSVINQFRLFDTLDILNIRCKQLNIPEIYYYTSFVNLSKSVMISLARLKNKDDFYFYLNKSWGQFEKITIIQGLGCFSSMLSKLLFINIKCKWFGLPSYFFVRILLSILGR